MQAPMLPAGPDLFSISIPNIRIKERLLPREWQPRFVDPEALADAALQLLRVAAAAQVPCGTPW